MRAVVVQVGGLQTECARLQKLVGVLEVDRAQLQQQLGMLQQALNGWEKLHAGEILGLLPAPLES